MRVPFHRIVVNWVNSSPHHALGKVPGQILSQLSLRKDSVLINNFELLIIVNILLGFNETLLIFVVHDILNINTDERSKI